MTTTATLTLAEFLLARLDEDEAVARAVGPTLTVSTLDSEGGIGSAIIFVGHFLPARLLADVAAKRAVVEQYVKARDTDTAQHDDHWLAGAHHALEEAVETLTQPYRNHPDYQQEWTPWSTDKCGHCGQALRSYGTIDGVKVCHTTGQPDCYRLVTVYGETLGARR